MSQFGSELQPTLKDGKGKISKRARHRTLRSDPGFWFRRLDELKSAVDDFRNLDPGAIKDHAMDEYLVGLARKALPVSGPMWPVRLTSPPGHARIAP